MEDQKETEIYSPNEVTTSKFRFYSLGIVAQNKPLSSDTIDVTPVEELKMLEGEITANTEELKSTSTDASNRVIKSNVDNKVTIKAKWLALGNDNRATSPDVRRGEQVLLYQYHDANTIYWTTIKQDKKLRKLETVIYTYNATQDEKAETDYKNSYSVEISTHRKIIALHTSSANGEKCEYDIQINPKDGVLTITDNLENSITIFSTENKMVLQNGDGSTVSLDKKDITLLAIDNINLNAKKINVNGEKLTVDTQKNDFSGGMSFGKDAEVTGDITVRNIQANHIEADSIHGNSVSEG